MKLNKLIIVSLAMVFLLASCADEDLSPIVTFDSAGKGAYPRLLEEGDKLVNLFDVSGSQYNYSVEFVDADQGNQVAEYVVDMTYEDNDPSNGDKSTGPVEFFKFTSEQFGTSTTGFKSMEGLSVAATEAMAAAGLTEDDLSPGDRFVFNGRVITESGQTFQGSNSSASVVGSSFRGHFDFTLPVGCPSDLSGTFAYSTTAVWCDGSATVTGEVDLIDLGAGQYAFSDWSFGTYGLCYGSGAADARTLNFQDVCLKVSYTGFLDSFGDTWTFGNDIDGETWTITWDNTYGESGVTEITWPGGVPFTIE
jgi:hypothetical protein